MNSILMWMCFSLTAGYIHGVAAAAKLPPTFKVCHLKNPTFDQCVGKAIKGALKDLVKGYPPLGIYSVDPLHITAVDIDQGTGPVSINLKFKEIDIYGLSQAKVENFKSDMKNKIFTVKVKIPKINLKGPYTIDGKVLILPIRGDGMSDLLLDDVAADITLKWRHFQKNGQTFLEVVAFEFIFENEKLSINLTNLFNGDKALGDNMNKFLNENSQDILGELKPAIQQTFGMAFSEITNRIFNKVPFDEIFPN